MPLLFRPQTWFVNRTALLSLCLPVLLLALLTFLRQTPHRGWTLLFVSFICFACFSRISRMSTICKHTKWAMGYELSVLTISFWPAGLDVDGQVNCRWICRSRRLADEEAESEPGTMLIPAASTESEWTDAQGLSKRSPTWALHQWRRVVPRVAMPSWRGQKSFPEISWWREVDEDSFSGFLRQ